MCHSWIITAHVSLGNMEKQWRMFLRQLERKQQLLNSIQQETLELRHGTASAKLGLENQ